jgi:ComF family protein
VTLLVTLGRLVLDLAGELLAPTQCAACDGPVGSSALLFCVTCAATVQAVRPTASSPDLRIHSVFDYGGAVATTIARLKYRDRPDLARRLAPSMVAAIARSGEPGFAAVVPVPLHSRRLAERGYNQASLLGARIATALGVRFAPGALRRVRDTPQQATLDRATRLVNLARAFEVSPAWAKAVQRGASGPRVLLVDDVRTTGATLGGCAAALRAVGIVRIVGVVLAERR